MKASLLVLVMFLVCSLIFLSDPYSHISNVYLLFQVSFPPPVYGDEVSDDIKTDTSLKSWLPSFTYVRNSLFSEGHTIVP